MATPDSLSAKDMAERETPHLDLPNTLAYLEGGLTKSRLKAIVFSTPSIDQPPYPTTEDLVTCIHATRNNSKEPDIETLLSLHLWSSHLNTVCKLAHHHTSLWHQSSPPSTLDIFCRTDATTSLLPHLDINMLETSPGEFTTYVIGVPLLPSHQDCTEVCELALWHQIYRPDGSMGNGWRQIILPSSAATPSTISALKFLDDETFLCLWRHEGVVYLLCLPYRCSGGETEPQNQYHALDDLISEGRVAHTFDSTWIPKYLVANGKKKRRNCVVVEEDRRRWKVFDLEGFRNGGLVGEGEEESEDQWGEDEGEEESMIFD
jgi:anaphase-promoting complex subunit 4